MNGKIHELLVLALEKYKSERLFGMCQAINHAHMIIYEVSISYEDISKIIPEFNRDFLNCTTDNDIYAYWWSLDDRQSRIEAFNKLIKYYSEFN